MKLNELETPCLVLDREKLIRNIAALHARLKRLGVNLRPHGKTAKNIDVVRLALAGQAGGITVSTLREAEYYFEHGIADIIYAVGVAPTKIERIAALIKRGARLSVILDSMAQARGLADGARKHHLVIPALIELDCDGHRSGVAPEDPLLVDIGRFLHTNRHTALEGVLTHAGASYNCRSIEAIRSLAAAERNTAVQCAETLRRNDLPCPTVSVGSTPTARFARDLSGITEVRAGVFIFYDLVMAGLEVCGIDDIALSVLASVIGHQEKKGWIITDAGWTALSRDRGTAAQAIDQGYGRVCDITGRPMNDWIVTGASQEHGIISGRSGGRAHGPQLKVGDLVRILPNHACATGAMHERYQVVDGVRDVVAVWPRVNGWQDWETMNGADRTLLQQVAERWIFEGWQMGRAAIVDELHAPDFVDHDPAGRPPDRNGFKQGMVELYSAFPEFRAEIADLAVDPDAQKVTVRWHGTGTHRGAFLGHPPTGRRIRFKGIEILHIRQGLITARWGEWDGLDIFAQLNAPSP